ncbi:MAG: hypothetical protein H6851_13995 [Geminicoccaceae bacterium]|nr:hypothetical protein [Geminicoccaceae bacterium]MCB9944716.1 hypothetical protein [Geminicoccaceae bacterium]
MAGDRLVSFERYVKIFNLVAGILLVGGTAFLIGTVVVRAMGSGDAQRTDDATLAIPAGATLVDTALGDDRLLLTFDDGSGGKFLLLVDARSDTIIRRIDLVPES